VERLVRDLDAREPADATTDELARWLAASPRFRTFAETHRAKIRKKLRTATNDETRRDVRAELLAARMFLADRRFDLAFEAHGAGKGGPDFTVTFRDATTFDLEITRLRHLPEGTSGGPLLAKLRQLLPGVPNAVVIAIDGDTSEALDVAGTARAIRARADAKDEAFFTQRGFDGSRDFYDRFLRLGAVLVWCEGARGDARASLWTNGSARIPVPEPAARACLACLRAEV
jgi:hypothetical protein